MIPDPGYATFPAMWRALVERFGPRECIALGERRLTFDEVDRASARLARALLLSGVGKGTRVGLLAPNGPDFVIGMMAAGRIGALLVPINTFYQASELAWTLRHTDVHTVLSVDRLLSHDYLARLEEAIPDLDKQQPPPLHLSAMPHLRQVRVWGGGRRAWALSEPEATDTALAARPEVDADFLREIEAQVSPADLGAVIYTSGSTATPKGVVHTQGSLVRHAWWLGQAHGFDSEDRIYTPNAFFFIGGFVFSLLAPLQMGACLLCEERFEPAATLDLIESERATIVTGWPHYGPAMLDDASFARRDLSSIRAGYLFEILPPGATRFHYSLGMSETCSAHSFWGPERELPPGSLGVAAEGVEQRIVDPETRVPRPAGESGELEIRGYTLMQGMYGREREEVLQPDGWYATGDHATLDENGHLYFHGRLTDVIKTGGANVSPQEVEGVLTAMSEIMEAHVVGLPDAQRGQRVVAALVLNEGAQLDADELTTRLRKQLAAYKVPRRFDFFSKPELPYKATGKVDKQQLIERLRDA